MNFESSVYVSELLNRQMVSAAQELAQRAVAACARKYDFDCDEALNMLGLVNAHISSRKGKDVKAKVISAKSSFPLPFNGELNNECCYALRQNSGLYTQCKSVRNGVNSYCKQCQVMADKTDGVPEYGTIQQRVEVGVLDYVDPKGRKPVAYSKIMKKYKISKEEVLEEASKFNININEVHFESQIVEKRGRPASKTVDKVATEKGPKGRPKKEKKVIQIEGDVEDLFAALVADANEAQEENEAENEAKIAAEKQEKEAEKQEKAAKIAAEKEEKAREAKAKITAEKEAKAAKIAAEKQEKAAKIAAEKQEKAREAKAKIAAEKEAKASEGKAKKPAEGKQKEAKKKSSKTPEGKAKEETAAAADEPDAEEEQDVVKKIEIDGKKYLKSKKSGIVYDYKEYINNSNQLVVGKWNNNTNKIDFTKSDEEIEEEYEEEDEEDEEDE
jgi:hypothetical protein